MSATRARASVLVASFLVSIFAFAVPGFAQGITRTPWQMYRNPIVSPVPDYGTHGHPSEYNHAPPIPAANANVPLVSGNGGWTAAPNGSTIGFGHGNASRLRGYPCRQALDFTFFQTLVTIPTGTTVTDFRIEFSGMDDGSRITIFNSTYPAGLVIAGSYVYLGATGTTNLKDYVVAGENRVVITQVDDCAVGNNLQVANVVLNGTAVQAVQPPAIAPPTFSLPFDAPDGACICTPLLMNTNQSGEQLWYVKADAGGGSLTFTVVAASVASGIAESVRAEIFNMAGNALVADVTASYTAAQAVPGFTAEATATVTAQPNATYRIRVTTPNANPQQAHFRLKADGAQAIGTGSPSAPSFEHEKLTWHFNVGANENLKIDVLLANPPSPSVTVMYDLFDPSGAFHSANSVSAPGSITVPNAMAGTWALRVNPTSHYRLSKDGGADRGIYLAWDSAGQGTLQAVAADGNTGNPNFTADTVEFIVSNSAGVEVARKLTSTGSADFQKLPAGVYKVRIAGPPGFTSTPGDLTVTIMCDRPAVARFVVADLTPPVIDPLANRTLEATGPSGADASWTAVANDPGRGQVPVTCTPPPGTFSVGTTTVECTAVDLAGNEAIPVTFTVNVVDTTDPAGACTPSFNPSGKNIPRASRQNEDGFYRVSSSDIVTASPTITLGGFTLLQGETVKFTQSPGFSGVAHVATMGPQRIRHFRVGPSDPVLTFTDEAGNTSTRTCYVPPVPK